MTILTSGAVSLMTGVSVEFSLAAFGALPRTISASSIIKLRRFLIEWLVKNSSNWSKIRTGVSSMSSHIDDCMLNNCNYAE